MIKPRSHLADFSAYLTLRLVGSLLLMMPTDWAVGLVRLLSRIGYWTARSRREIALDNLRQAFPGEYTPEQSNRVIRDVFEHFGIMLLEMLLMPRKVHRGNWQRLITMADPNQVRAVFSSGRPVIIVTAHHGNWELGGFWPGLLGIKPHVVVRPHDNPYIEPLMKRFREGSGGTMLSKNGDAGEMRAVLINGGVICTVGDQDAGPRGMFVDFFGRPASTHKAIAVLALRTRALMYVCGMYKTGGLLHYTVYPTDLIRPEDYAGHPNPVVAVTQRMTTALERLVRLDPRQYLWFHRRWKHQPVTAA